MGKKRPFCGQKVDLSVLQSKSGGELDTLGECGSSVLGEPQAFEPKQRDGNGHEINRHDLHWSRADQSDWRAGESNCNADFASGDGTPLERRRLHLKPRSKPYEDGVKDDLEEEAEKQLGDDCNCHKSRADQSDWRVRESTCNGDSASGDGTPLERRRLQLKPRSNPYEDRVKDNLEEENEKPLGDDCSYHKSRADQSDWRVRGSTCNGDSASGDGTPSERRRLHLKPRSKPYEDGVKDNLEEEAEKPLGDDCNCHKSRADQSDWRAREPICNDVNTPSERRGLHLKPRSKAFFQGVVSDNFEQEKEKRKPLGNNYNRHERRTDQSDWRVRDPACNHERVSWDNDPPQRPCLQLKPRSKPVPEHRVKDQVEEERVLLANSRDHHESRADQSAWRARGFIFNDDVVNGGQKGRADESDWRARETNYLGCRVNGDDSSSKYQPLQLKLRSSDEDGCFETLRIQGTIRKILETDFVLDSNDFAVNELILIPRRLFDSWPLKPRIGDCLAMEKLPCVVKCELMSIEEQRRFSEGFKKECITDYISACHAALEQYQQYMTYACSENAWTDVHVITSMVGALEILLQCARTPNEPVVGKVVALVIRSEGFQKQFEVQLPNLVRNGMANVHSVIDLCKNVKSAVPAMSRLVDHLLFAALSLQTRRQDAAPAHWTSGTAPSQGWSAVLVDDRSILGLLQDCLATDGRELGRGRDVQQHGSYSRLRLQMAWRLEHPYLWQRFDAECNFVEASIRSIRERHLRIPRIRLRDELQQVAEKLPCELNHNINEIRLLHGTSPENLLSILSNGVNERFSRGIFGFGSYFAEDAGKSDQYAISDERFDEHSDLHKRLFRRGARHPNKAIFYVIICRVVMGCFVRTQDGETALEGGGAVFDTNGNQRELAPIPGATPPVPYHALLAETGEKIRRHREFVQFHENRIYPEYLIAYMRI